MASTDNTVLIKAPIDLVWDVTNDVENWTELFTEYAAVQVLDNDGQRIRFRLTTHPDPDGQAWSWVSERAADVETRTVHSRRIETGPFEHMTIDWDYTETAEGVLLRWRQDFTVKAAMPFDDQAMTDRLNAATALQQAVIKARLEGMVTGLTRSRDSQPPWHRGLAAGRPRLHADALVLLTCGHRIAAIVRALAELRIADQLVDGPRPVEQLAADSQCQPEPLRRVLRAAATIGLFAEQSGGEFALTPLAGSLLSANPYTLEPLIDYSSRPMVTEPYRHLLHSLRTGQPATYPAFGVSFWQQLEANPDWSEFFDQTMTRLGRWETDRHLDLIEPERFERIADLGGGAGHFLSAALRRAPRATGVLAERAEVVEGARKQLAEDGVLDRVDVVTTDLFAQPPTLPPGCDAFILKAVLHNWPDADGRRLLTALRRHIGDSGAPLFIVEQVVAPGNQFDHAKFLDVDMLVLFGGVERDLPTWRSLLSDCGFGLVATPDIGRWTVLQCQPI